MSNPVPNRVMATPSPQGSAETFSAVHGKNPPALQRGGPPADVELLEGLLDHSLSAEREREVLGYVCLYLAWAEALKRLTATVPTAQGPPVDAKLMGAFLKGKLRREDESQVRRNIRLYRNWYDAANED